MEMAWLRGECDSPPSQITVFPEDRTTPLFQNYFGQDYERNTCGYLPYIIEKGCCMSSLNVDESVYQSVQYRFATEISEADYSIATNNQFYCVLENSFPTSHFPFTKKLIRNDSCVDGFKCINENLLVYQDKTCTVLKEIIDLDKYPSISIEGHTLSIRTQVITKASVEKHWTQYVPVSSQTVNFSRMMDVFGVIAISLALFLSLIVFLYFMGLAWIREPGAIRQAFLQICWFSWVLLMMFYWTAEFSSKYSWQILNQMQGVVYGVVSFCGTLESLQTILRFFDTPRTTHKVHYFILLVIHISLSGGNYLLYLLYIKETSIHIMYWCFGYPFWNVFQFSINTFPPIYIVIRMIQYDQELREELNFVPSFSRMWNRCPQFFLMIVFQMINTIAYAYLYFIYCLTNVAGDDSTWMSLIGFLCLANVLHEVMNCVISVLVKKIIFKTKNPDSSFKSYSTVSRLKDKFQSQTGSFKEEKSMNSSGMGEPLEPKESQLVSSPPLVVRKTSLASPIRKPSFMQHSGISNTKFITTMEAEQSVSSVDSSISKNSGREESNNDLFVVPKRRQSSTGASRRGSIQIDYKLEIPVMGSTTNSIFSASTGSHERNIENDVISSPMMIRQYSQEVRSHNNVQEVKKNQD
jgi:hypothetical protein